MVLRIWDRCFSRLSRRLLHDASLIQFVVYSGSDTKKSVVGYRTRLTKIFGCDKPRASPTSNLTNQGPPKYPNLLCPALPMPLIGLGKADSHFAIGKSKTNPKMIGLGRGRRGKGKAGQLNTLFTTSIKSQVHTGSLIPPGSQWLKLYNNKSYLPFKRSALCSV